MHSTSRSRSSARNKTHRRNRRRRRRLHWFEALEPRIVLAAEVFEALNLSDTLRSGDFAEPYSLREAMVLAHQSTADTVIINLQAGQTYDITRSTNSGPAPYSYTEYFDQFDPQYGDFDIQRNLVINGKGATIDAQQVGRVFEISGGVDVTLNDVTLINGLAPRISPDPNRGGAMWIHDNAGGSVTIHGSLITENQAIALGGSDGDEQDRAGGRALGGAIAVIGGELILDQTTLSHNVAQGGDGFSPSELFNTGVGGAGGRASGGAIDALDAGLVIRNQSVLEFNSAFAGSGGASGISTDRGGPGGDADGGGISLERGALSVMDSLLRENQARGGDGGRGSDDVGGDAGSAEGGAIYVAAGVEVAPQAASATFHAASIHLENSRFEDNQATGGQGGNGREHTPAGGQGGDATGGAIEASHRVLTTVLSTDFARNQAVAGSGGQGNHDERSGTGGDARGGAIQSWGQLTIDDAAFNDNLAEAGNAGVYLNESEGSSGGEAAGGAVHVDWLPQYLQAVLSGTDGNWQQLIEPLESQITATAELDITAPQFERNRAQGGNGSSGFDGQDDSVVGGEGGQAGGGAVWVGQNLTSAVIRDGDFRENEAIGGHGGNTLDEGPGGHGGQAAGGGLLNRASQLELEDVYFLRNRALGGHGGDTPLGIAGTGGVARGGALASLDESSILIAGTVQLHAPADPDELGTYDISSRFTENQAIAGQGGSKSKTHRGSDEDQAGRGGAATGGAIYASQGTLDITQVLFTENLANSGSGGYGHLYQNESCGDDGDQACVGAIGAASGDAQGGAIFSSAELTAFDAAFTRNSASGPPADQSVSAVAGVGGTNEDGEGLRGGRGAAAMGGALYLDAGGRIDASLFLANSAIGGGGGPGGPSVAGELRGGQGGAGGDALGAAIYAGLYLGRDLTVTATTFDANTAIAGPGGNGGRGANRAEGVDAAGGTAGDGGDGGNASGGALAAINHHEDLISDVQLEVEQSEFRRNKAVAGDGGWGGSGGFTSGEAFEALHGGFAGHGGDGGDALGGGLYLSAVPTTIQESTFADNILSSGWGGQGGHGGSSRYIGGNGGEGGHAGLAAGAGIAHQGAPLVLSHSTLVSNVALAGSGGAGGHGSPGPLGGGAAGAGGDGGVARGGGVYHLGDAADLQLTATTIVDNVVNAAAPGFPGIPGVEGDAAGIEDRPVRYVPAPGTTLVQSAAAIFTSSQGTIDPAFQSPRDTDTAAPYDYTPLVVDVTANATALTVGGAVSGAALLGTLAWGASQGVVTMGGPTIGVFAAAGLQLSAGPFFIFGAPAAAVMLAGIGLKVSIEIIVDMSDGASFNEATRAALGDPGEIVGPNIGVLLLGGNGEGPDFPPPQGNGADGAAGAEPLAEGAGIYGAVTLSRSLVAQNQTRTRQLERQLSEPVYPHPMCPAEAPFGLCLYNDVRVFEVTPSLHEHVRDDVTGGAKISDGTNLIGLANSGFSNDLHGTSAAPLAAQTTGLAYNGGPTRTLALLPTSPALNAISLAQPDTSQNGFVWQTVASIGAWGGEHSDDDGVPDAIEDLAPDNGDANGDAIPDRSQGHVASLPNRVDGQYLTLLSDPARPLRNAENLSRDHFGSVPENSVLPVGFVSFQTDAADTRSTVTIMLPEGVELNTYYLFGPTPEDPTPHFYEFLYDGTTGAQLFEDRVVLHFVDGQRGDHDLDDNGVIDTLGAAALADQPLQDTTAPSSHVDMLSSPGDALTFDVTVSAEDALTGPGTYVSGVTEIDLYVATDDGPFVLHETLTGTDRQTQFTGASNHTYKFRSVARDAAGNQESKPLVADTQIYLPDLDASSTPELVSLDVQRGAVQRSFVRYLDLHFNDSAGLDSIVASLEDADPTNDRIVLRHSPADGMLPVDTLDLRGLLTHDETALQIDFGPAGIGGNARSAAGDGSYQLAVDTDGDGSFDQTAGFHRLLGDVNGDRLVDRADMIDVMMSMMRRTTLADVDGDGRVDLIDRSLTQRALGNTVVGGFDAGIADLPPANNAATSSDDPLDDEAQQAAPQNPDTTDELFNALGRDS